MSDTSRRPSETGKYIPASGSEPVPLSDDRTQARHDPRPPGAPQPLCLGEYKVLSKLGEGGMGAVYLAEDTRLKRKVAIKTLRPELARNPLDRERFEREARAAAAVEHDNIVPIWHVGAAPDGSPFIAMPFLQGEALDARLKRERVSPQWLLLKVGGEVAAGLAAAHAAGLVHRDIKPGNVWLEGAALAKAPEQQVRRCKILDFGLARSAGEDVHLTARGAVLGTPAFMSPEQARGESVDARTDLFSLGVMLYRMATGRPPFAGGSAVAVLVAVTTETPAPVGSLAPHLPPSLAALIDRLLRKKPTERPRSAAEVADAVRRIEAESARPGAPGPEVLDLPDEAEPEPQPEPKRRRRAPIALAAVALVLAGVVVALLQRGRAPEPRADPNRPESAQPAGGGAPDVGAAVAAVALGARPTEVGFGDPLRTISDPFRPRVGGGAATVSKAVAPEVRRDDRPFGTAVRNFSDPLQPRAWPPKGGVTYGDPRFRHWDRVHAMACSPTGKWVATAAQGPSDHSSLRLWDAATGREVAAVDEKGYAYALAFSPDGKRLAVVSGGVTVALWEVGGDGTLRRLESMDRFRPDGQKEPPGSTEMFDHVRFSGDGKTLFAWSNVGTVWLWSAGAKATEQAVHPRIPGAIPRVVAVTARTMAWAQPQTDIKKTRVWVRHLTNPKPVDLVGSPGTELEFAL